MAIYAVWNNKGGVGKSYLSFQLAAEYQKPTDCRLQYRTG